MRSSAVPTSLFVTHTAILGGAEIALANLLHHLDRTRTTPEVLSFADGPLLDRLRADNIPVHLVPLDASVVEARKDSLGAGSLLKLMSVAKSAGFVAKLARTLSRLHPDIVHCNTLKADLLAGTAARIAGRPLIWHIRDRIADDYLPRRVCAVIRRAARAMPHRVIANSQATLDTLAAPASPHFTVVHDGTDLPAADPAPLFPPGRPPTIALVGRLSPWKGQHVFLDAAAVVRRTHPATQFLIVGGALFGNEAYETQIRARAAQPDLTGAVTFTGNVANAADRFNDADIAVHASTSGEPFGQVVIEAMARARPTIATAGGGVPEIITDNVDGLLTPMGDAPALATALLRLLADPALAARLGASGRRRVADHFTLALTARRVEAVHAALLAAR